MSKALDVGKDTFQEEVLDAQLPVLVDFWAEWCGPCQQMLPVIDAIVDEFDGQLKVCKVNVDDNEELVTEYGIRSIPTMIIFSDGEVQEQLTGFTPQDDLTETIEQYV